MKRLTTILSILLFASGIYSQTDKDRREWAASILGDSNIPATEQNRIKKFNFAPLWTRLHDNDSVLGFIGDDYQRLRVVILSATKRPGQPGTYNVTGKSMVKDVVRSFTGTMKITHATSSRGKDVEEDYKAERVKEAGLVFGEYNFSEDAKQSNTGTFSGVFVTYWVVDRNGRFRYDEVMTGADGYLNNQFAGTWTSHRSKSKKAAHWGDSRIPAAGDLDIGAGEFSPDEKYISNGWESYRDAYFKQDKRALAKERRQWWR